MAQQNNPFSDAFKAFTDFSAFSTAQKPAAFDVNAFVSAQRRNVEAFSAVNQVIAESVQAVLRRQAEILQANASDVIQLVKDVTSSSCPENARETHTAFAKNALETAIANTRELAQMVSKSNIEVIDVIGKKLSENANEVANATKAAAKKAA
jgi:phasin family protein